MRNVIQEYLNKLNKCYKLNKITMKRTRYKLNKLKRHIVVYDNIENEERFTIIFRDTSEYV